MLVNWLDAMRSRQVPLVLCLDCSEPVLRRNAWINIWGIPCLFNSREMADDQLTIAVDYGGTRKRFTFPKRLKVQEALEQIGKEYRQPIEYIYLLYQSLELAENSSLGDVFPSDRIELAYLVRKDAKTLPRQGRTVVDLTKRYYGYCKTCKACVVARPVFFHCREQDGKFRLRRPEPVDLFMADVPPEQLVGECIVCGTIDATAKVRFECGEEGSKVAFLKSVRCNGAQRVACMMCQQVKERIFLFPCQSRHSLCLDCFSSFCKVALGSYKFRSFDCGFSVTCPGPDESCSSTPVEDPHHFQLVDKDGVFYHKFNEEAVKPTNLIPSGDNVMCTKCLNEITLCSGANVQPAAPPVQVPGREYSLTRLMTRLVTKPVTAPVGRRSKVTCPSPNCKAVYCLSCKKVWHDGPCPDPTQQEPLHIRFKITPAMAAKSRWPED